MYIVGITGASGSVIGIRVIEKLLKNGNQVGVIVSNGGKEIIRQEALFQGKDYVSIEKILDGLDFIYDRNNLTEFGINDFNSLVASGSGNWDGIAVVPSSMKTMSSVANGYSDNLITRGCDVALKEGRPCVIVPRETPFNLIHIENMSKIVKAGGKIVPPIPAFYYKPQSVDDIIDYIVEKIIKQLGVNLEYQIKWGNIDTL